MVLIHLIVVAASIACFNSGVSGSFPAHLRRLNSVSAGDSGNTLDSTLVNSADKDWSVLDSLWFRIKKWPNAKASRDSAIVFWRESESDNRQLRTLGLKFYKQYPSDQRRWIWFGRTLNHFPFYSISPESRLKSLETNSREPIDTALQEAWDREYGKIWADFLKADIKPVSFKGEPATDLRKWIWGNDIETKITLAAGALKHNEPINVLALQEQLLEYAAVYPADKWIVRLATPFVKSKGIASSQREIFLDAALKSPNESIRVFAAGRRRLLKLQEAPIEMRFTAMDGRKVELSDLRGKVILVDFWATSCSACIAAFPKIKEVYNTYKSAGFEIVSIALDPEENKLLVQSILKRHELPWIQVFAGKDGTNEYAEAYQVRSLPEMFLLDKQGMLVQNGSISAGDLAKSIKTLLLE